MKKITNIYVVLFLVGCFLGSSGFAQKNEKLAQSGFQFLSVVSDARAAGMAEAMTSLQTGSSALFFNPAGMSEMSTMIDVTASINQWIADIKHNTFSLAISPAKGDYGVIGFSAQSVDYGKFIGTQVVSDPNDLKGYRDVEIFKLNALALGVGYAKRLTDRFSVGGQVRWVRQDLGSSWIPLTDSTTKKVGNELTPLVFDFGTQFKTGIKSLVFGMSVRNFSKEVKYVEEGFQAPLVFSLGISMNVLDLANELPFNQSLYVSIDASHYRDHPEQLKFGFDYQVMNMLSLRGGYVTNNFESGLSLGVGVSQYGFAFDYAYTPFGVFDKVHRMTARFSL
jgi:hypothetical protein